MLYIISVVVSGGVFLLVAWYNSSAFARYTTTTDVVQSTVIALVPVLNVLAAVAIVWYTAYIYDEMSKL